MLVDQEYINKEGYSSKIKKLSVGIHTGSEPKKNLNFATLITKDIYWWMCHES